jgi:hypothetical protein
MRTVLGGEVYVYASAGNTGTDSVYWYHRSFLKGEEKIFSGDVSIFSGDAIFGG